MSITLRQKLAVLVFVVLVPLTAVIGYQLSSLARYSRSESVERTHDEAQFAAVAVEGYVTELAQRGRTVATAVIAGGMNESEVQSYLDAVGLQLPGEEIAIFTPDGEVIGSTDEALTGEVVRLQGFPEEHLGTAQSVISVPAEEDGRSLIVFSPATVGGRLVALSAVRAETEAIVAALPRPGIEGGLLITDREGWIVYADGQLPLGGDRTRADYLPTVEAALEGEEALDSTVEFPGDSETLYIGAQLPVEGLTVGYYSPSSAAYSGVVRSAALTGAIVLVVLVIAALAARRYALGIVDVVTRLTEATHRVAGGDFDAEVPIETRDEIGTLARDFARMQTSLRLTFEDEALLSEAALKLSEATTVQAVASVTLEFMVRLVNAEWAVMTVFRAEGEPQLFGQPAEKADALARAGRAQVPDPSLGESPAISFVDCLMGCRRLLSMPLSHGGELLGRVDVALRREEASETERSEVQLGASLARHASTALENVILFEREQLIADTLQDSLLTVLPQAAPLSIGLEYRPATVGLRVGGDFYDFIQLGNDRFVVIVGDIAGKGLDAARQTAVSKGALRTLALDDPSPRAVSERANRAMFSQLESDTFLTSFVALIDTSRKSMTYATAGHPPPVLSRANGRVETLRPSGPPLGVVEDANFPPHSTAFSHGDTLVVYSDGISEARDARGEFFGEAGVSRAVTSHMGCDSDEMARAIVRAAEKYSGGQISDDLTVVVVRFAEVAPSLMMADAACSPYL